VRLMVACHVRAAVNLKQRSMRHQTHLHGS
jgi:hypothetical protein